MNKICKRCKGNKFVIEKTKILATCQNSEAIVVCPDCNGIGYIFNKRSIK